MTNKRWLKKEKDSFRREMKSVNRHLDFIDFAEKKQNDNADWDCYWSWYYHSNCTPQEAFLDATDTDR